MKFAYPACFYKDISGYSVIFPDLCGCATQGDTLTEAMEMAEDAASGWLLLSVEDGDSIPQASDIKNVSLEYEDGFVSMVLIDLEEYAKSHSNKAVKKTLTIPAWVNNAAEQRNMNFSAVLKDAILQQLQV